MVLPHSRVLYPPILLKRARWHDCRVRLMHRGLRVLREQVRGDSKAGPDRDAATGTGLAVRALFREVIGRAERVVVPGYGNGRRRPSTACSRKWPRNCIRLIPSLATYYSPRSRNTPRHPPGRSGESCPPSVALPCSPTDPSTSGMTGLALIGIGIGMFIGFVMNKLQLVFSTPKPGL